jgi:hypothetical protein
MEQSLRVNLVVQQLIPVLAFSFAGYNKISTCRIQNHEESNFI